MAGFMRKREFDYFDYFNQCAKHACRAADQLHEALSHFNTNDVDSYATNLHAIEHEADQLKHTMIAFLGREFMTPIEREDIMALAQQIDSVVDAIEEVIRRIRMFNVTRIRPETLKFTALICQCTQELAGTVDEFRRFKTTKEIKKHIVAVNTLESEGDELHSSSMRALFQEDCGAEEKMVWMTIFECLEMCFDECEDTVDIIESIILKNT